MMNATKILVLATVAIGSLASASALKETLKSFEDHAGYVQPLATTLGTMQNTGWAHSARVGQSTGWTFALNIPLAYIGTDDHTYTMPYDNGCAVLIAQGKICQPVAGSPFDGTVENAPTIWGGVSNAAYSGYVSGGDGASNIQPVRLGTVTSGMSEIRNFTTVPMPSLQFAYSHSHFRGAFRILAEPMPIKAISFDGAYFAGLGIQYDFSQYLPAVVSEKGVFTSVAFDINHWNLTIKPQGDISGELNLSGTAYMPNFVVGYRYGKFEAFTEIGYEQSSMQTGGDMIDSSVPVTSADHLIQPRLNVDGRNGFRMSFNIAMHLGVWQPVLGQSVGAQMGSTLNLIQFGKEGE